METLELPVAEELDEATGWPVHSPVKFEEQPLDLAAFELWRQASCMDTADDEDASAGAQSA